MPDQIGPHLAAESSPSRSGIRAMGRGGSARSWLGEVGRHPHFRVRRVARFGLGRSEHAAKRLALIARHRDPYERCPELLLPERHINAAVPSEKVQRDCLNVGPLSGTKGILWQYTAIDVASAYTWAERAADGLGVLVHQRPSGPRGRVGRGH